MELPPNSQFLDIRALLDRSQPRSHRGWLGYGAGFFLLIVLISAYANAQGPAMAGLVHVISAMAMLALVIAMVIFTWLAAREHRAEQIQLEAIEELVTLRRWPQAAVLLETMLSRPTRTGQTRVHALIYLSGVLARYHRFDDAIMVQNYLLDNVLMDQATAHGLRLGRVMGMLREDHLVDADRAINELRRLSREQEPNGFESAGLALVEIYRDVKTGHPAEALEAFKSRLPAMRQQLGLRVGDAWALAARAYDLLNQPTEAQEAFENATLLARAEELSRRYPEVAPLVGKYHAATMPAM